MKNTFGHSVAVTVFGESHGEAVGVTLDGFAPGVPVELPRIRRALERRSGIPGLSTARREPDEVEILSGTYNGYTSGAPLTLILRNRDPDSAAYDGTRDLPRPSHADYTARVKYHGYEDPRGGGHFSGRLTAPLTAAGAIAMTALAMRGIRMGTHILSCRGIRDRGFEALPEELDVPAARALPLLNEELQAPLREMILTAAAAGDSLGGVLETVVCGLPAGIGEPMFDTVEGLLSRALFAIPAVKGVEFGDGFALADKTGSESNDALIPDAKGGIRMRTNHGGGADGGITNGMPLCFRCVIKPTPSVALPQQTVDLRTGEAASVTVIGRHDPAIFPRAAVVVESMAAFVLCDLLAQRYGTDWPLGGTPWSTD